MTMPQVITPIADVLELGTAFSTASAGAYIESDDGERTTMTLPDSQTLLLPVLKVFSDGKKHSIEELRERMRKQFSVTPDEVLQKHPKGNSIFYVNVALALANLQGAPHQGSKAIEKVGRDLYRVTEYGKAILRRNPSSLTLRDL
jgi:restriction system protein